MRNFRYIGGCARVVARQVIENHVHFIKVLENGIFFTRKVRESHGNEIKSRRNPGKGGTRILKLQIRESIILPQFGQKIFK